MLLAPVMVFLLCGLNLGKDADGNNIKGKNSQRTCTKLFMPCMYQLSPTSKFFKPGDTVSFLDKGCAHELMCPRFRSVEHLPHTLRSTVELYGRSNAGDPIRIKEAGFVERASDSMCRTLDDHHAAELKADVLGKAYRHHAEKNRVAGTAAAIAGNLYQDGLHVSSSATVKLMKASGIAAASLSPANWGQFDRASTALQNRSNAAVEASLLSAIEIVGLAAVAAGGAPTAAAAGRAAAGAAVGVGCADGVAATAASGGTPPTSLVYGGINWHGTAPPAGRAVRSRWGGPGGSSSKDGEAQLLGATAAAVAAGAASAAPAVAAAIACVAGAAPFAVGWGSSLGATGRDGINARGRRRGCCRDGQGSARGAATDGSTSSRGGGSAGGENVFPSMWQHGYT